MDDPLYMLTTKDNPYSPFTHYDEWDTWDRFNGWHINEDGSVGLGYYTSAYLARVATTPDDGGSPAQYTRSINDAIDEILSYNVTGNYVKVQESDYENWIPEPAPTL